MRRLLRIRVAFSPTRLSSEHLRAAYEQVVPTRGAAVSNAPDDCESEKEVSVTLSKSQDKELNS